MNPKTYDVVMYTAEPIPTFYGINVQAENLKQAEEIALEQFVDANIVEIEEHLDWGN